MGLRVTLADGRSFGIDPNLNDLAAWERYAMAHGMGDNPSAYTVNQANFQIWRGARKLGVCDQDTKLEEFIERVRTFEVEDDDAPDPTLPVPGDG